MKVKRTLIAAFVILLAGVLSACTGQAAVTSWPGMTSDGEELVYLADGAQVYAVKLNGQEAMAKTSDAQPLRFPLEANNKFSFYAAPGLSADGSTAVVGNLIPTGEHTLFAFNTSTGAESWTYNEAKGPWMASALVTEDGIYAPNGDGYLYALDLNGGFRWKAIGSDHGIWSHPVTDGTSIYIVSLDHKVFALDPQTGTERWSVDLENAIIGAPTIADGVLYVGTLSGSLFALNANTGSTLWVANLTGGIWGSPAVNADTVFVGTVDGTKGSFYAVQASDGVISWAQAQESSVVASPVVLEDKVVFVTEAGSVRALSLTGDPLWQATIEGKLYTTPLVVGDQILVAPMQAKFLLAAYDMSGTQKWSFSPSK